MMMSAPAPDWIAEVMRDCRSLALTVSTLSVMPVAFLHSCTNEPLSSWSDAGTKSVQRSQWTLAAPWAMAGARPVARMAARPPADDKTLRRAMRVIDFLPGTLCFGERVVVRWNYVKPGHEYAGRGNANQLLDSNCTTQRGWPRRAGTSGRGRLAGTTLTNDTPVKTKPQPRPWGAGTRDGRSALDRTCRQSCHVVFNEERIDDRHRDRAEQRRRHQLSPIEDV